MGSGKQAPAPPTAMPAVHRLAEVLLLATATVGLPQQQGQFQTRFSDYDDAPTLSRGTSAQPTSGNASRTPLQLQWVLQLPSTWRRRHLKPTGSCTSSSSSSSCSSSSPVCSSVTGAPGSCPATALFPKLWPAAAAAVKLPEQAGCSSAQTSSHIPRHAFLPSPSFRP